MQAILPLMLPPATVSIRSPVRPSIEAWILPEAEHARARAEAFELELARLKAGAAKP